MDDFELFDKAANKSVEELKEMISREETDYRTYADTQIFKENGEPTDNEWKIIKDYIKDCNYKYNDDKANEIFAISFNDINQREDSEWGDNLVSMLNDNGEGEWYLGDDYEEYVFCY